MKRLHSVLYVFLLAISCSKKNPIPASATVANITITFPGSQPIVQQDYSVASSGAMAYSIDGGGWGSTYPLDAAFLENLSGSKYYHCTFNGFKPRYFSIDIVTPAVFGTAGDVLAGSFAYGDSVFIAKNMSMTLNVASSNASPAQGSFILVIYADSVRTPSGSSATNFQSNYITIGGTIKNWYFY